MTPRRALILSAGRGERLRPLTDERPKTMMPIDGCPLLEYHVVLLRELGVRELAVNLHHKPEVVMAHFGDGSGWGVSIRYSLEEELLGTAGAARRVAPFLGAGTFVVLYGDNLMDFDLRPLFELHERAGAIATLAVVDGLPPTAAGIVSLDAEGRVTRFLEKPLPQQVFSSLVNAGIYVMEPEVLDFIPSQGPSDFGRDVLPSLIAAGRLVYAREMEGYLSGIDTPELYRAVEADVRSGRLSHPLSHTG
jgi:mannose-1-phosphate guanylyltransferase/mannose-1-phosphate guanylyltransferase/phosphomannomutase